MDNSGWEPGTVGMMVDKAGQAATQDPEGSLLLIQDTARAAQNLGASCLISRILALWAWVLAIQDRLDKSAEKFQQATLCDCCRSWVERLRCSLVIRRDGPEEAAQVARTAVELAKGWVDVALGHATLGTMLIYCEQFDESCTNLSIALKMVPLKSSYWKAVHENLSLSLSHSSDVEVVRDAVDRLREAPAEWVGIKGSVLPRANHAWMLGQALARLAEIDDSLAPAEKQNILSEAVDSINLALEKLEILGLHLDIMACRADLALILTRAFPLMTPEALTFDPVGVDQELSQAWKSAGKSCGASSTAFIQKLSNLRKLTVEQGASSPILSYGIENEGRIIANL